MYGPLNNDLRKTLPPHIGAGHMVSAKGWVESLGFKYIAAHNKAEVDKAVDELCNVDMEKPILVEVFTTINTDIDSISEYYKSLDRNTLGHKIIVKVVKKILPQKTQGVIKKIIGRS